ncbi:MAG: DUF6438 domain-containing protein [Flavobacteriales bacterium]
MKQLSAALVASTLLLAAACKNKEHVVAEPATPTAPATVYGGAGEADSLFFSLERTPCFGQCKTYRIQVYRSGFAVYEGSSFVEKIGTHHGRVGSDTLALLLRKAEEIDFFNMQDRYDSQVTDLPSTIVQVVANGKNKRVVARVGTPPALKSFAAFADELLFPVAWKPVLPVE